MSKHKVITNDFSQLKEINAHWEARNTGMKTCELIFSTSDTIGDYLYTFEEKNYDYIVAKVPNPNVILVHELEKSGFRFMETQFCISVATKELDKIYHRWEKILSKTSYKKLNNKKELEFLTNKIMDGMFKEDRISIDEYFDEGVSTKRYINWITDIYNENTANIYLLEKYNSIVGFFVMKEVNNIHKALIAGIFKEYQGYGLSIALIYYYLKIASETHVNNVFTSFSSNNLRMLNSFSKTVSFRVLEIFYVLRKIILSEHILKL